MYRGVMLNFGDSSFENHKPSVSLSRDEVSGQWSAHRAETRKRQCLLLRFNTLVISERLHLIRHMPNLYLPVKWVWKSFDCHCLSLHLWHQWGSWWRLHQGPEAAHRRKSSHELQSILLCWSGAASLTSRQGARMKNIGFLYSVYFKSQVSNSRLHPLLIQNIISWKWTETLLELKRLNLQTCS